MAKTIYYTAATLDGFIADPNHSLDWLFQFTETGPDYNQFIAGVGAMAMGASTYLWILDHLSLQTKPEAWPYKQPAWVFTTRDLPRVTGADIRFVRGDVRSVHEEMVKAAGGNDMWVVGGGDLAGQFLDRGLLDELQISVASVTLGEGKPLLPRRISHPPLRLVSAETFGGSFVHLIYEVPKGGRTP